MARHDFFVAFFVVVVYFLICFIYNNVIVFAVT